MSAPKWHEQAVVAFDTETTGIDTTTARIVTAAVVHMTPGQRPITIGWTINPADEHGDQVNIPTEASDVHGWTTDRLRAEIGAPGTAVRTRNGQLTRPIPADVALFEIAGQVAATIGRGQALVVHNAAYDLTLLEQEALRYDVDPLSTRPAGLVGVVDPMVIEKAFDPYRKACYKKDPATGQTCDIENRVHVCGGCRGGKTKCGGCGSTDRTLTSLCAHYGVRHAGAHDAGDDAIATVRLLHKLLAAWPDMARWRLKTLHDNQIAWRTEQCDGLRSFFDKVGKAHDGMCPSWPLHTPACAGAHIAGDHDGHLLNRDQVQALVAHLEDLRDMHDTQAIDVEEWPTLAGLFAAMRAGRPDLDDAPVEKPCDRPGCRAPHNWTGGRCLGNQLDTGVDVDARVAEVRSEVAR